MTRRSAAAVLAVLVLTGCSSGGGQPHEVVETRFLDQLSAAITGVNTTRQRLADDAVTVGTAAARLDDVDAVAVTGDRAGVRAKRAAAARAVSVAAPVARRLAKDVQAYDAAVAALAGATGEGLDDSQRKAVDDVVSAGRRESGQLHSYATVIATVWPRYEGLNENQVRWLARASNGWYRNQQESAGAYAVLTDRAAIDAARRSLESADAARLTAAKRSADVIAAARTALASLIG